MDKTMPQHPEARAAKKIDVTNRLAEVTQRVYLEAGQATPKDVAALNEAFSPDGAAPTRYTLLYGDVHGHTVLSDGAVEPEDFFEKLRNRMDFCVLTDHDHGGLWRDTLYGEKWRKMQTLGKKYTEPGVFSALVGYERDSYPWYDNMIVYFGDHDHPMLEGAVRGETNAAELEAWLAREDLFLAPHDTTALTCSTDFSRRPPQLMPHGIELYSRGDCAEYFDHPLNVYSSVRGGSWQDALAAGAHPAAIAGSDDHDGNGGVDLPERGFPCRYPGMTAVYAKENTPAAIFAALRARRCYAFMGPGRIAVDFRINGHLMGARITEPANAPGRRVYWKIESETPPVRVTLVKNGRDHFVNKGERPAYCSFVDYERQQPEDCYYLRVELADGRMAWTSPCWVAAEPCGKE